MPACRRLNTSGNLWQAIVMQAKKNDELTKNTKLGVLTKAATTGQRKLWSRRATSWDHGALPGLHDVVARVIAVASPGMNDIIVDLGCGTGALTLPIAEKAESVIAVDISDEMLKELDNKARASGIINIRAISDAIEKLTLESGSIDIVVTNYALHHLRDPDKVLVVRRAYDWLKPGGRLVIGDMMFGRGATVHDRKVISSKVAAFAKKGPAGWWRIAKNVAKFMLKVQERPATMSRWIGWLEEAGFTGVQGEIIRNEAAVVYGVKPTSGK